MILPPNETHIWRVALDLGSASEGVLSPAERERAARFHSARDRAHFVTAHGALRRILAGYLNRAPEQIGFATNGYGKPGLVNDPHLEFNLAHSHALALIAVMQQHAVGVDVEWIRSDFDRVELAGRFFAPAEIERVRRTPERFFEIWTRKEAFIKAIGMGVSFPLQEFDVCEDRVNLLSRVNLPGTDWFARTFVPVPGYVAAVVTNSPQTVLGHFDWHTN